MYSLEYYESDRMKVCVLVSFVAHTYPECLGVPWPPPGDSLFQAFR